MTVKAATPTNKAVTRLMRAFVETRIKPYYLHHPDLAPGTSHFRLSIAEGQALVRRCLARNQPGPYQIQAAIHAVHSDAPLASATDWRQILALYDQFMAIAPSPVAAVNRAVAVAEVDGPGAALAVLDRLGLDTYYLFHAIRADLLRRLGRHGEAALAYAAAIARTDNAREREFLQRRRQQLE